MRCSEENHSPGALSRAAVPVVVFALDLPAGAVLFAVHLLAFRPVQGSAVGLALGVYLLVDARLPSLRPRRFTGGHLARALAVGDPLLLIGRTLIGNAAGVGGVCIMVLAINLLAGVVLLAIDLLPLRLLPG